MPVDGIGLAMLVVWVGALQIMLDTGKDDGWFDSTQIIVLSLVSLVGFIAFMIWQYYEEHPIVDLSFFRNRNFTVGVFLTCVGYAVFFANVVILPLWLQTQLGYTATWAGLVQAPAGVMALLLSPFVGRLVNRYDARWFASIAFIAIGLGVYLRAQLNSQAAFVDFMIPMIVQGVAMAFFFVAVITLQLDGIPPQRIPAATSISNFLRITAAAFATSIATTTWDNRAALHQSRLAESSGSVRPDAAAFPRHAAGRGPQQRPGGGRAHPRHGRAVVHAVVAGRVLGVDVAGARARAARLAHAPAAAWPAASPPRPSKRNRGGFTLPVRFLRRSSACGARVQRRRGRPRDDSTAATTRDRRRARG